MSGLSVIIPSKTTSNLIPCLRAVHQHEPTALVIVVDDGIPEADRDLSEICTSVRVNGARPFVFARNVNLGIQAAGQDDVIVLNDDALLETPGGLSAMQEMAERRPEYGLIASTCNNVGNCNQWRQPGEGLRDEPRMVCFVCVLIPRKTIDRVGLLDERYTGYGCDDDDYSLEVRRAGLKIGVFDGCYVDHGSLRSSYRGPAGASGDFRPNLKLFIQKWGVDNWGQDRAHSQFRNLFPPEVS